VRPRYLLDTNVVSEPLRPVPSPALMDWLRRHDQRASIASVVWHELQFGVERLAPSRRRTAIQRYLDEVVLPTMPIFDYDLRAAEWHARERARLESRGASPPFADGQIAAIAAVNDLVLITSNEADFAGFDGIEVRHWIG
jgi:tRNA(fMet)-specific endonuclease VapC